MNDREVKRAVRDTYAGVAKTSGSCCGPVTEPNQSGCGCGVGTAVADPAEVASSKIGYSAEEMDAVPEGANLGLGCGNPTAIAALSEGETVLDLGSGPGFDCFLAANRVGDDGHVIGVDMTTEMIERSRDSAEKSGYGNVEFRLGELENLPIADGIADVVMSNCVINLVPDKERVFAEAFRALKSGGRLAVSDIVLLADLPEEIENSLVAYAGCVSGAIQKEKYLGALEAAGFEGVEIVSEKTIGTEWDTETVMEIVGAPGDLGLSEELIASAIGAVASITVNAVKP